MPPIRVMALTPAGAGLAQRLCQTLEGAECWLPSSRPAPGAHTFDNLAAVFAEAFAEGHSLVCIMAAGIVVRQAAPLLQGKDRDPAVVVVDEEGRFAVSLLSGHLGGANRLARRVALVSGGDAGIYGMAGLVLEICAARGLKVGRPDPGNTVDFYLEMIPGIPALAAGAALLGAPLMHDFVAISLSDLLTPWEVIERRVEAAAQGDFVIVLYNPKSKKRDWQLKAVVELLLRHREPQTPVGLVRRAMRSGEEVTLTTLLDLPEQPVDMQTIIIVGNSQTFRYAAYLVTPRGYLAKYQVAEPKGDLPPD